VTFGFLSHAGFESAGSLGEETRAPTRAIPRSILLSVVLGGVLYTVSPVPPSPYNVFPYVVAAWLAIGLALTFAVPGFSARVVERLGLGPDQRSPSARARSTASDRVEAESLR
jgi:hypothetical protein